MAQNAVGRLFRSRSALRQSWMPFVQVRHASAKVPSFTPTSSPELDQALSRIRDELFIPYSLDPTQKRLVFKQKYSEKLDEEPVTVTIGDEKIQLRPMDHQTRPRKEEIVPIIKMMKTTKDWQNVIPLLTGLREHRRFLTDGRWEWLVRMAGNANAMGIILECAKQADRTGFRLRKPGVVQRVFFELHRMAHVGPESAAKALRLGRQMVDMMDWPEHVNHDVNEDPKRRPFLIGGLLELYAIRAWNELGGKDADGAVQRYAERLLTNWRLGAFEPVQDWVQTDHMLQQNVPIWSGLAKALQVDGVAIREQLRERERQLHALISKQLDQAPQSVREKPTLGYKQAVAVFQ
ncbi:hypothetical protein VTN31DRAFT_4966 [Thermomyces dupontii]|uniref:uncharacterized protein n=1 Tax=Talaromyces thermophilus TaxID=28565 RepID=UPI0037449DAA